MADRIVRGYWDCPYCDSTDIDGLVDNCPNCGRHKPENTKYHLKGAIPHENKIYKKSVVEESDVLNTEELHKAGISEEECDGNHKEWVCSYCNSLNNWADDICTSCGSPRNEATVEYGMQKRENSNTDTNDFVALSGIDEETANDIEDKIKERKPSLANRKSFDSVSEDKEIADETSENPKDKSNRLSIFVSIFSFVKDNAIPILLAMLFLLCAGVLFYPHKETVTVTGFEWARNISIEDLRTVQESDWSVPSGGRVYKEQTELKTYVSVIDHYETKTETKSRQVIDHYDTEYSYSDNGNGTFTEHTKQVPVYKTEYYEETHQEPVYRQDPVYATKYYYDIDKWFDSGRDYPSSGTDQNPYWNTDYTLAEKERDTDRTEKYTVFYDNGKSDDLKLDDWLKRNVGDQYKRTYCLLFTYKTEELQ